MWVCPKVKLCSRCGMGVSTGRKATDKRYWIHEDKIYCLDCWNFVVRRLAALGRLGLE